MRYSKRAYLFLLVGFTLAIAAIMLDGQPESHADDPHESHADKPDKKWQEIVSSRESSDEIILANANAPKSPAGVVLSNSHANVVAGLSKIASTEKLSYGYSDSRTLAMEALGRMAKDMGIPTLVRHVEFAPPMIVDESSFLEANPAALALWDSGFACFPHIIHYLRRQPTEKVSDRAIELYARIMFGQCKQVVGNGAAATELVRTSVENTSDVYNGNLKRLYEQLKKMEKQPHSIAG